MTYIPIAVFWLLIIWGMRRQNTTLHTYLLFATVPLGSFAVIPTGVSGGLTLTGPPVVASFMLLKSIFRRQNIGKFAYCATRLNLLGLLFGFWLVACFVTLLAPRIYANRVEIVPMSVAAVGIMGTDILTPTKQNITQMLYLTISVLAVFVFSQMYRSPAARRSALHAFRVGAVVTVLTGILDALSFYLPISPLLEIFRTAGYALATEVVFDGSKRVVGLMSEASAFGGTCLFFMCFTYFSRFTNWSRDKASHNFTRVLSDYGIVMSLALMMLLSLSSSAYVGLAAFGLLVVAEWTYRCSWVTTFRPQSVLRQGLRIEWIGLLSLAAIAIISFALSAGLREELSNRITSLLLDKSESLSYEERSMWTAVSLQSLWETSGFGCGLGGTRASNKVVAVFSNTGLIGGVLFYGFVLQTLLRRPSRNDFDTALMHAIRWSFPPIFLCDYLAGTTPDFGLGNAWMYGIAAALTLERCRSHSFLQENFSQASQPMENEQRGERAFGFG